jgi:hypothetical protein
MGHYRGLSRYDGKAWTNIERQKLSTSKEFVLVTDVAVAPDGKVWVTTDSSVAMVHGDNITIYEKAKGFDVKPSFDKVAVDSKGMVWVGGWAGPYLFNGTTWIDYTPLNSSPYIAALTVDSTDQVWFAIGDQAVGSFDGKSSKTYEREGRLARYRALAIDDQGRIWGGTDYGLEVFDGKEWHMYYMHNSDLTDNMITSIAIPGKGLALPTPKEKKPGSVTGVVKNGRDTIAGRQVGLCSRPAFAVDTEGRPTCLDLPFSQVTKTDDKGMFTFKDVPVGRYMIVVQAAKTWLRFWQPDTIRFGVKEGETTALGDIDINNHVDK